MTTDVYIIDKMILQQILKKEKDGYGFTSRFIDFLAIECIIDNLPIYQQAHSHLTPLSYIGFVLIPHFLAKAKIDNLKRQALLEYKERVDGITMGEDIIDESEKIMEYYLASDEALDELDAMAKITLSLLLPMGFMFKDGKPSLLAR